MARSKLRENQVQDVDFLSEAEHATTSHTFGALTDVPALSGNEGKYLRIDSTASGIEYVTIDDSVGIWKKISSDYTASVGDNLFLDSTVAGIVITMPSNPVMGSAVAFIDGEGNCATNNITISGAGAKIMGLDENFIVDVDSAEFNLVYYESDDGWRLGPIGHNIGLRAGDVLVDRGDPADYDFTVGDFTCDSAYHDLDLSSIVPSGATWVKVKVVLADDAVDSYFALRKNGNTNTRVSLSNRIRVVDKTHYITGFVPCDSNRVIEYSATNTTFTTINLVVTGWVFPGSVNDALKTDGTAGRVYRACYICIKDGTNANTINCEVFSRFNGDIIAETDNIVKDATTGHFTLDSTGHFLYIESTGLTGNTLHAMGCLIYADIGIATPICQVKRDESSGGLRINLTDPITGDIYDFTSLVDNETGYIYIDFFYLTDE